MDWFIYVKYPNTTLALLKGVVFKHIFRDGFVKIHKPCDSHATRKLIPDGDGFGENDTE